MKVAFTFVSMPVGGAEDFAISIARHLPPGWEAIFVCLRSFGVVGEELKTSGVPVHLVEVAKTKRISLMGIWKLSRWFAANDIAVVHSQTYHTHIYAIPAARLAGIPSILHQQKTLARMKWHRELLMKFAVRIASGIVTLSARTGQDFEKHFGIASTRISIVPNVIDFDSFRPAANRQSVKTALGLPVDVPIIGGIASLTAVKNHGMTIEMLRRLRDAGLSFLGLLLGNGTERERLAGLVQKFQLSDQVKLPGARRPISPWLQSLDILVLPSHWEGQPMILLQAIATGVPIVASKIEGNVAALGDHPGLFEPGDLDDYLDKVRRVLINPEFRTRILVHQHHLRDKLMTAQEGAARLAGLYSNLVSSRS